MQHLPALQVAHQQILACLVYLDDLVEDPHIDVEAALEALRCLQQESITARNVPPDVIGQAAVGKTDELSPLEHHYLGLFIQAPRSGRRRCSPGHAAHDQDPFHLQDSTQQEMTNK